MWMKMNRFSGDAAERGVMDGWRQCGIERWTMDNVVMEKPRS